MLAGVIPEVKRPLPILVSLMVLELITFHGRRSSRLLSFLAEGDLAAAFFAMRSTLALRLLPLVAVLHQRTTSILCEFFVFCLVQGLFALIGVFSKIFVFARLVDLSLNVSAVLLLDPHDPLPLHLLRRFLHRHYHCRWPQDALLLLALGGETRSGLVFEETVGSIPK